MTTSRMSKKALALSKHIISSLPAWAARAKSAVVGNKTSQLLKARVAVTSLVMGRKKKMLQLQLASVCDKIINTALGTSSSSHREDHQAVVLYNPNLNYGARECIHPGCCCCCTINDGDGVLLEINNGHSDHNYEAASVRPTIIANEISEEEAPCLRVVDVHDDDKSCSSTEQNQMLDNGGATINEEDDIDEVADMFIMRFHKQMRLQKLESFKRYQEMLQSSL